MTFYRRIPLGRDDALVVSIKAERSAPWLRWPRLKFSIKTEAR